MRKRIDWIDAGAPRGEGPDPLEGADADASSWQFGEPELIVELEEQHLPATGIIDYRYVTVDLALDRDVWVRAVDLQPGNRAVLHHALVSVTYPDGHELQTMRRNRYNPDPTPTVRWGEQSFEEMMLGYMSFVAGHHPSGILPPGDRAAAQSN